MMEKKTCLQENKIKQRQPFFLCDLGCLPGVVVVIPGELSMTFSLLIFSSFSSSSFEALLFPVYDMIEDRRRRCPLATKFKDKNAIFVSLKI